MGVAKKRKTKNLEKTKNYDKNRQMQTSLAFFFKSIDLKRSTATSFQTFSRFHLKHLTFKVDWP